MRAFFNSGNTRTSAVLLLAQLPTCNFMDDNQQLTNVMMLRSRKAICYALHAACTYLARPDKLIL